MCARARVCVCVREYGCGVPLVPGLPSIASSAPGYYEGEKMSDPGYYEAGKTTPGYYEAEKKSDPDYYEAGKTTTGYYEAEKKSEAMLRGLAPPSSVHVSRLRVASRPPLG